MKRTTHLIGDREGSREPASSTRFGWRKLGPYSGHAEAELRVAEALESEFGVRIIRAGERTQSYDIEVSGISRRRHHYDQGELTPGLYEVKSLWRKNDRSKFDRRFKVGTRGEMIYGRRDSEIKAFALALEDELDRMLIDSVNGIRSVTGSENRHFVDSAHEFIDQAIGRRHSKAFEERLVCLARAALFTPALTNRASSVLSGSVSNEDILRGFSDLEGIFVVAGPLFTLITRQEVPNMLAFDSASSEGPKLRMHGDIPSEHRSEVIPSKPDKIRKGKKAK